MREIGKEESLMDMANASIRMENLFIKGSGRVELVQKEFTWKGTKLGSKIPQY